MKKFLVLLVALSGTAFAAEKIASDRSIYFADVNVLEEPSVRIERDVNDFAHSVTEVKVRISLRGCLDRIAAFAAQHYFSSDNANHAVIYVSAPIYANPGSKAALCNSLPYEDRTIRFDHAAEIVTLLNIAMPLTPFSVPRKNFDETVAD